MKHSAPPLLTWRHELGHHPEGSTSVVISLVRALAAFEVAAAHLRALCYPGMRNIAEPSLWFQGFAFFTGFAHQAVLLFFIISGWLVGGSLLDKWKQPEALGNYAIDRLTRLWTVLIPVFLLTLLLAMLGGQVNPGAIDYSPNNAFSVSAFVGNLLGLQLIAVPNYGDNFVLWSLSNETWYYLLFPLLIALLRTESLPARTLCAVALVALALALPPILVLYFTIWLLGAACSRIQINCKAPARGILILATLGASVYFRLNQRVDDLMYSAFPPDLVLSCLFLLVLCSLNSEHRPATAPARWLAQAGRYGAEFSFTLYVIHVPLIELLRRMNYRHLGIDQLSPHRLSHFAAYCAMLALITIMAWLFYLLFESRTKLIRRWAKRKLLGAAPARAVPV